MSDRIVENFPEFWHSEGYRQRIGFRYSTIHGPSKQGWWNPLTQSVVN